MIDLVQELKYEFQLFTRNFNLPNINFYHLNNQEVISITVVINTMNRFRLLTRALFSISMQTKLPREIIIINNGNKFTKLEIDEICGINSTNVETKIYNYPSIFDLSTGRSEGLKRASSEIVTYLDDDNIMFPTWLENGYKFITESKNLFIYGKQIRGENPNYYLFGESFSLDSIRVYNSIDTNSIMHVRRIGRWTPLVSRLTDWNFVLNFVEDFPASLPVSTNDISVIYKTDAPNRITSSLYFPFKFLLFLFHSFIPNCKEILNGLAHYCPICQKSGLFMVGPGKRKFSLCPNCGSLERYRSLFILNEVIFSNLELNMVKGLVLECSPSESSRYIFKNQSHNYFKFDLRVENVLSKIDFEASLSTIPLPDCSVKYFVALHVLEHLNDDLAAMAEISRILAPGGLFVLQVPISSSSHNTREEEIIEDELRILQYGQIDHVRLYGRDILTRLKSVGLYGDFFSINEILPSFLIDIFSLNDGFDFIIGFNSRDLSDFTNIKKITDDLKFNLLKLTIFSSLFQKNLVLHE